MLADASTPASLTVCRRELQNTSGSPKAFLNMVP